VREIIKVDSVRDVHVLPGGVGYVQFDGIFRAPSDNSAGRFHAAQTGRQQPHLDLRNNPGGAARFRRSKSPNLFPRKASSSSTPQGRQAFDPTITVPETEGAPLALPVAS